MVRDALVIGTRPEIIKCAPIIKAYERRGTGLVVIHTNQHYSRNMDEVFFQDLGLRAPDFNLNVGSGTHAVQTGKIMAGVEALLVSEGIGRVLVQGDTNTVLGAALAASKLQAQVAHVEAGLRSHDRAMPEEINRVVTDHVSDFLFCPTPGAKTNVIAEGIPESKIHVVGNTIVDATQQHIELARKSQQGLLDSLGVVADAFILLTAHRPANVDDPHRLAILVDIIRAVVAREGVPVIFPVHPRTRAKLHAAGMEVRLPREVLLVDPVGYLDFLVLEAAARYILTDSGGVQEEACILRKRCITLRENTERPETVGVGSNILAGLDVERVIAAMDRLSSTTMEYVNPFGAGDASERIHDVLHGGAP